MINDLPDCADHIVDVGIAHPVKHGQAYQPLIGIFDDWKLPPLVSKAIAVIRMAVDWDVMHIHANVLRSQGLEYLSPAHRELR